MKVTAARWPEAELSAFGSIRRLGLLDQKQDADAAVNQQPNSSDKHRPQSAGARRSLTQDGVDNAGEQVKDENESQQWHQRKRDK